MPTKNKKTKKVIKKLVRPLGGKAAKKTVKKLVKKAVKKVVKKVVPKKKAVKAKPRQGYAHGPLQRNMPKKSVVVASKGKLSPKNKKEQLRMQAEELVAKGKKR
jgi:hypothetical protein